MQTVSNRERISKKFDLFQGGTGGLDSWLSQETPDEVFDVLGQVEQQPLSRALFNQLLTLAHEAPVSKGFFNFYWLSEPEIHPYDVKKIPCYSAKWSKLDDIVSLDQLYWGLYRFYVDALLNFGNIRTAFQRLRGLSEKKLAKFFLSNCFDTQGLAQRGPSMELGSIKREHRYLISELANNTLKTFDASQDNSTGALLTNNLRKHLLSSAKSITIRELFEKMPDSDLLPNKALVFKLFPDDLWNTVVENEAELKSVIADVVGNYDKARGVAINNTNLYLSMVGDLDVYVATSIRRQGDFLEMADFCRKVFGDSTLKELNLRYFDPTLSATEQHEDKGLIECLMVKCAKVLVLNAGGSDSFGKDAEAAMALTLGKPVIIYADQVSRGHIFRDVHPLSRLINFENGVAIGSFVADSQGKVIELLHRIFNNDVEYILEQPRPQFLVLKDKCTGSDIRLQTSNGLLRETFWNHYHSDVR